MKAPFALERYLTGLRDRTAWARDWPLEECDGPRVPREALYRIAHVWALAVLDDRFDTLLLPVLVTEAPALDELEQGGGGLSRAFFEERLNSGACLLLIDGPDEEAARWPRNRVFYALQSQITCRSSS